MNLTDEQKEALCMEHSLCVTAGAGTGKTFLLSKRYIEYIRTKHLLAKEILALTYTDKAAAEMKIRIEQDMRDLAEKEDDSHLRKVLDNFAQNNIGTFHSFCSSLIREFADEAHVDVGYSVMDDFDKHELVSETINSVLQYPPENIYDDVVTLYRLFDGKTIKETINNLLPKWDTGAKEWFEKASENPDEVIAEWQNEWERARKEMCDEIRNNADIEKLMSQYSSLPDSDNPITRIYSEFMHSTDDGISLEKCMELACSKCPERRTYTAKQIIDESLHNSFKKIQADIKNFPLSPLTSEDAEMLSKVSSAFNNIIGLIYTNIKREKDLKGMLDFDDLIYHAHKLIKENKDVRDELCDRYKAILVDEVQDNDSSLTEIVDVLCGDVTVGNKLFVVGDAKQSIYGFRGADVNGFIELMKRFGTQKVNLCTNFRSVPQVVERVNNVFSNIFINPDYESMKAHRADDGSVTLLKYTYTGRRTSDYAPFEAQKIASWIANEARDLDIIDKKSGLKRKAGFGDIVVLIEKRTRIPDIIMAFEKYGIKYTEYKGKSFYDKQEVHDFTNLLKAILYPDNDISLYGVLRSPYFTVSDAELCRVGQIKGYSFNDKLKKYSKQDDNKNSSVSAAYSLLEKWRADEKIMALPKLVSNIIAESGILTVYSADIHGKEKYANLEKLIDIIRMKSASGSLSLAEFLSLTDLCINEKITEEEGTVTQDSGDTVKIMTVHASKGLEFPIVIVAFCGENKSVKSYSVVYDDKYGAGFKVSGNDRADDKDTFAKTMIKKTITAKNNEEKQRLFYVAATRAKDHLLLSASVTENSKTTSSSFYDMYVRSVGDFTDSNIQIHNPDKSNVCTVSVPDEWTDCPINPEPVNEDKDTVGYNDNLEFIKKQGLLMHEIFAGADINSVKTRYGMSKFITKFVNDFEEFRKSELMKDAVEDWCELPVSDIDENRRIDRLVKYADGKYGIIDYKLGKMSEQSDDVFEIYRKQLTEYSELLGDILGRHVSASLYFVGDKGIRQVVE